MKIRQLAILAAGSAILALTSVVADAKVSLRFGHVNGYGEVAADLFQEFADRVRERTAGEVDIKVFPAGQLGKEIELVQQAKLGGVDITAPSMPAAAAVLPSLEVPSTPFLWDDWDQARAVIEGEAMQPVWDELESKHNLIPLAKTWYWGWRNMTLREKAVTKPEDVANLKIRTPEQTVWVEMIKALGGVPTPVPFADVYVALQQKLVDGQENPIPTIYSRRFFEVQGYLVMTRHMLQNNMILINKSVFERLTPRFQRIVLEEARAASARNTLLQQSHEKAMLKAMRDSGKIQVIDNPDRAAFAAKTASVPDALQAHWGAANIKRVRDAIAKLTAQGQVKK
ncbi:TRAP transporter substrate-binding protein [Xanthobacteraceae bacterium Astr-EGSB]|uniref:TRAP transporter substrate-binding protein n=1 Tax=Astrobacterium formosum TaxID=3069710 RepID=UPI0027B28BB9|nr:TRAP transporter substrate-binding protein [Xanthobacteraceae bacterium Astr-EGSB]